MEPNNIEEIEEDKVRVHGLLGSFNTPDKEITVHYFSTKANGRVPGTGEYRLLEELQPMRELVDASRLEDLSSLLQRDLNDARVATELVPYLQGGISEVAFFPAILGVLIPAGFISDSEDGEYPIREVSEEDGKRIQSFGDEWSVTAYKTGGNYGPLGMLSFSPSRTDVIVLDGQHRVNAFRYICGILENESNDIYESFYHDVGRPDEYSSDLPVTLIWFERNNEEDKIDPTLISRNLFVDVNNSAEKVSKSRNILLDDRKITSLLTRFSYSFTAEKSSFDPDKLSLLHSGFDIDTDLSKRSGHDLTITNPEIVEYTMSWLFFGSSTYNSLDRYKVYQERQRNQVSEFQHIFDDASFSSSNIYIQELTGDVLINSSNSINDFKAEYKQKFFDVFYDIINGFGMLEPHYDASEAVSDWRHEDGTSTWVREAWDKVFNGGEGLYYSLMYSDLAQNPRLNDYRKAVNEIEERFKSERTDRIDGREQDRIDRAFSSVRTKAFSVGIFMALKKFGIDNINPDMDEKWTDLKDEFIQRINNYDPSDWVYIVTEIKSLVQKRTDPKKWPTYQKIILRVIQEDGGYYNAENFLSSPDGQIFEDEIHSNLSAYIEAEDIQIEEFSIDEIPDDRIRAWAQESINNVNEVIEEASLSALDNVSEVPEARKIISSRIDDLKE
jgi:hypothetical protein